MVMIAWLYLITWQWDSNKVIIMASNYWTLMVCQRDSALSCFHELTHWVLLWKQTLRVVAEHCRWSTGPLLLAELSGCGMVEWVVPQVLSSSSVPKHPTVSPCCTQFLMEVIFLVFVFTCNPLPLIFLSWYSTGLLQGEGRQGGEMTSDDKYQKGMVCLI